MTPNKLVIFSSIRQEFFPIPPLKNFIAVKLKWPGPATKEVKTIKELTPLKQAIRKLAALGEEEHEELLINLAAPLSKIVRTYQHKGTQLMPHI